MPGPGLDDEGEQPLVVHIRDAGDRGCHLTLRGEFDLHTAPLLRQALDDAVGRGRDQVVIDAAGVRFLDSSALMVLLAARDAVVAGGGRLHVAEASTSVRRVLEMVALTDLLLDSSGGRSSGEEPPSAALN
jgi:anti-sigma B factor antagonist